jgi:ribosomal-protein-alanine N-acetyltransferase
MNLHERFPSSFIVAEENGEIIGYIMCRMETRIPHFKRLGIAKKGHIISVAVLSNHQREGVGYALMQNAMRVMWRYEVQECYLEVRSSNELAVNLYKKMGFEIKKTIKHYYADGEGAYLMARKLPFSE